MKKFLLSLVLFVFAGAATRLMGAPNPLVTEVALKLDASKTTDIDSRAIERVTCSAQAWVELLCCFFIELFGLNQFSCRVLLAVVPNVVKTSWAREAALWTPKHPATVVHSDGDDAETYKKRVNAALGWRGVRISFLREHGEQRL